LGVSRLELHTITKAAPGDFLGAHLEHSVGRVTSHDVRVGMKPGDHEGEVACAGCKVENASARRKLHRGHRLAPPRLVDAHRHQPVQEVVAACDLVEHLP
jgi:hypothetical protein